MDPSIVINVLVELGQNEEALADLQAKVARDGKRALDSRELAAELEADAAEAKADGQQADGDFRRVDRELRAAEALLVHKRDRLVGVSDRRQYRAMQEEIAALERRIEELEMAGLTALSSADEAQHTNDLARQDVKRAEARAPAVDPAEGQRRTEAVEELSAEIERLSSMLPPDVGGHVKRLRLRGDRAVAWVKDGTCTGCYAQMPAQQGIAAQNGRLVVRCASCARFVVHQPWH